MKVRNIYAGIALGATGLKFDPHNGEPVPIAQIIKI